MLIIQVKWVLTCNSSIAELDTDFNHTTLIKISWLDGINEEPGMLWKHALDLDNKSYQAIQQSTNISVA